MKQQFVFFIHSFFKIKVFERGLVGLISIFPRLKILKNLAPPNKLYSDHDIRYCERYGIKYELHIKDYLQWSLYFYIESDSSFGLLKYIKEGDHVFDAGGNIGQTAMMMAKRTGSRGMVYTFEPFIATFQQMVKNLGMNPGIKNIVANNFGLGDKPGMFNMYRDCLTNAGGNRIVTQNPGSIAAEQFEVVIDSLDNYFSKNKMIKIDFIKIDVEGYELNVLKGSTETIKKYKPVLFIEMDDENLKQQKVSAKQLLEFLFSIDYAVTNSETGEILSPDMNFSNCHFDIIGRYKSQIN